MEKSTLQPTLGLFSATMIVVGVMVGSGIFIVSADIARNTQSPFLLLLSWVLAGIITVLGAYNYSKLSAAYPTSGGQYVFIKEAWGKLPAFLYGWAFLLVIQTGFLAAVSTAFAKYTGVLFPSINQDVLFTVPVLNTSITTVKLVALAVILFLTWINRFGIQQGALINNVLTVIKIGSVLTLIAFGLAAPFVLQHPVHNTMLPTENIGQIVQFMIIVFPAICVGPLFSADAWNNVTFLGDEVKEPEKLISKAMILGTSIVVILYLLANVGYLNLLSFSDIAHAPQDRVGTLAIQQILGASGAIWMAIAIMISTFGCVNAMTIAGARVIYAMAKDGLFFKTFEQVHPKFHSPNHALWVQGLWACVLALSGSYLDLLDFIIFSALIFYIVTVLGVYKLQPKVVLNRWYHKVSPAIYAIIVAYLTCVLAYTKASTTLPGLVLIIIGLPLYYYWQNKNKKELKNDD